MCTRLYATNENLCETYGIMIVFDPKNSKNGSKPPEATRQKRKVYRKSIFIKEELPMKRSLYLCLLIPILIIACRNVAVTIHTSTSAPPTHQHRPSPLYQRIQPRQMSPRLPQQKPSSQQMRSWLNSVSLCGHWIKEPKPIHSDRRQLPAPVFYFERWISSTKKEP